MTAANFICGCAGLELNADEKEFIGRENPWGLILFKRNVESANQLSRLTAQFREIVGRDNAPILIDQEGGRVQRMGPPVWRKYPAGANYAALYENDPGGALKATGEVHQLMAHDLVEAGINVDCLPVLDVPQPGSHKVIGDRAYGAEPHQIADLARAACEGLLSGGVLPVIKHIPGHGRAMADSHLSLPVVDTDHAELSRVDFAPFAELADMPMAMTAHVVYSAIDADRPATLSPVVVDRIIRGEIGYDGLVMTDDLSMQALSGSLAQRAEASVAAGCDMLLHCNGVLEEMQEVASQASVLDGKSLQRAENALSMLRKPEHFDQQHALNALEAVSTAQT